MAGENLFFDVDGRKIPYSLEAEQAVLGSILIDPQSINLVASELKPHFFYLKQHEHIYRILSQMLEFGGAAIDFVSVLERLKSEGVYDEAGGKAYLTQLMQFVPSSANIGTYVDIIRERFYARSLMSVAQGIIKDVEESAASADKLINAAEQKIFEIRSGVDTTGLVPIQDVILGETFDRLGKLNDPETRGDYIGIPTGLSALDRIITGLNKSDMIILGARPGMGKTSFALNIARNVAMLAGKKVCFFSLEMTRDQLAQRLLSGEAGIESTKLRTGELTSDEWTRLIQAGEDLGKARLYLDETSTITVPEMKAKLLRLKDVDLVIIDYLGLMKSADTSKEKNRVNEIGDITRSIKIMAKELKIPIIVCAQLSRATEGKTLKSHKPALADLRDSGSIEQDADIVLFLYRDAYYNDGSESDEQQANPNQAICTVAKNRHGSANVDIPLNWDGAHTRFTTQDVFHS